MVAADDLGRDWACGCVPDLDALDVDDVGRPVLGVEDGCGLRGDPDDVVCGLGRVDGQPAAGRQVEVEEVELGQQALGLGLLVGRLAQPLADRQQSSDELLLGSKAGSSAGTCSNKSITNYFVGIDTNGIYSLVYSSEYV